MRVHCTVCDMYTQLDMEGTETTIEGRDSVAPPLRASPCASACQHREAIRADTIFFIFGMTQHDSNSVYRY